jgi:histone deacetylase 1/2
MSASEYFNKMKALADTLASIGTKLSDEEILGYMLAGLGLEYEPLVASLTSCDDVVSLNSFYAFFLSVELRIDQNAVAGEIYSSTNAVSRYHGGGHGGGHGNGGPQQSPQQGGQGGRQGYHGDRGQGRGHGNGGRGNGGGPKPTCQVCNKYGHDALCCRNRFNHAYQPEEQIRENREHAANAANIQGSGYTIDTNWYMDSGATDHLTSDLDRLHLHERYSGKDHV